MTKTLTIVIPVYNTPPVFLQECLSSINLPEIDYEIIAVNDGSASEATLEYLQNLENNAKYRLIHKVNGGLSSARNAGIEVAEGKYILPLDSDDILVSETLREALKIMENNSEYDILYGDFQNFGDKTLYNKSGTFNRMKLAISGDFVSAIILYKKKVWNELGGYDISFKNNEDWDFSSRAAVKGYHFYYLPKPLFKYRRIFNGESLSQNDWAAYARNKERIINAIPRSFFTKENINDYILNSFKRDKKLFWKTFIILFFPKIYWFLRKNDFFKNNIIVD